MAVDEVAHAVAGSKGGVGAYIRPIFYMESPYESGMLVIFPCTPWEFL